MKFTKKIRDITLIVIFTLGFVACSDVPENKVVKIDKANVLKTIINVEGMTCEGCELAIQGNISKLDGVVSVKASHTDKNTVIEYDKTQTNAKEIEKVISETGYKIFQESEKEALKVVPSMMKCGEGKCGTGKCGHSE